MKKENSKWYKDDRRSSSRRHSEEKKMVEIPILEETGTEKAITITPTRNGTLRSNHDLESTESSSSSQHDCCVTSGATHLFKKRQTRKNIAIGAGIALCFLSILFIVIIVTIVCVSQFIKSPTVFITGNLAGNMSAELGTLGHVNLHPDLKINLTVNI